MVVDTYAGINNGYSRKDDNQKALYYIGTSIVVENLRGWSVDGVGVHCCLGIGRYVASIGRFQEARVYVFLPCVRIAYVRRILTT